MDAYDTDTVATWLIVFVASYGILAVVAVLLIVVAVVAAEPIPPNSLPCSPSHSFLSYLRCFPPLMCWRAPTQRVNPVHNRMDAWRSERTSSMVIATRKLIARITVHVFPEDADVIYSRSATPRTITIFRQYVLKANSALMRWMLVNLSLQSAVSAS